MTISNFEKHSRVSISTIRRKFNSWENALNLSGVGEKYSGKNITEKMKVQDGKGISSEEILEEMHLIAKTLDKKSITRQDFDDNSLYSSSVIRNRFGNWENAVKASGLKSNIKPIPNNLELFENILNVWTHYGRQPLYSELSNSPSIFTGKTYATRFGGWLKALYAFELFTNSETEEIKIASKNNFIQKKSEQQLLVKQTATKSEDKHSISLGLRYKVLDRDRFCCVKCGRSPALEMNIRLHVDHIIPFSKGGKTVENNLQTTCSDCNLGKGNRYFS